MAEIISDEQHEANVQEFCNRLNECNHFPEEITGDCLSELVFHQDKYGRYGWLPVKDLDVSNTTRLLLRDYLNGDFDLTPLNSRYFS